MDDAAGVRIDASADSIAEARRMVVEQLRSWGLAGLADDARLVVSELLTNAALHAHPPVRMKLSRLSSGVKLEVSDGSPDMPIVQRVGTDVMTGRGWNLITALSRDWGVQPASGGKVVWATLQLDQQTPAPMPGDATEALLTAELIPLGSTAHETEAPQAQRYEVVLGDVPTDLLIAAKAQIDALMRECALMASGSATGTARVPDELSELITRVVPSFSEARLSIKAQAVEAKRLGHPVTHLVLRLPLAAADAGQAYLAALDEVDAYCRDARMLTLESSFEHRVFRHWYVEELAEGLPCVAAGVDWVAEPFVQRLAREEARRTREEAAGA